jgi:hypothetical protein
MTMICASYLLVGRKMFGMNYAAGMWIGGAVMLITLILFIKF